MQRGILKYFNSSPISISKNLIITKSVDNHTKSVDNHTNNDNLICFTDGSAINNGKIYCKAAFAVIWPDHPTFNYSDKVLPATNNRAEYSAVIYALIQANEIDPTCQKHLHVYTDSMLLINSLTIWMKTWKKNGFITKNKTKVLNIDLLLELDQLIQKRITHFHHVKAHTNANTWEAKYNDMADKLARLTTSK